MSIYYQVGDNRYAVTLTKREDGYEAEVEGKRYLVKAKEVKPGFLVLMINGKAHKCCVAKEKEIVHVFYDGGVYRLKSVERLGVPSRYERLSGDITSPISGKVVKVNVRPGDHVEGNQVLLVIEAMKMEYQIKAPYTGVVEKVHLKEGSQVDIGARLVDMRKEGSND
ncbi:MAG: biotin/lipoyl-containing protein [Candidatus Thermoplasmatota archaeon]